MANKAMDLYLNDHLAGAMLGSDLADQIKEHAEGSPLAQVMATISAQIEEDRQTLIDLMDRLGTPKNPVKQATTWVAEKASRVKFSGLTSGEPEQGTFMALESLRLGVEGKLCLWLVLKEVRDDYSELASVNLDELIERAVTQRDTLELERIAAGKRALHNRELARS
jgi:hypothetical protein